MNYHNENVAADLGHADDRSYVPGEWVTYDDAWTLVTIHGGQTTALVAAVKNNLNVVYLPHGVELHAYVHQAIINDSKKEEGPT